jgi:hypothetical protein
MQTGSTRESNLRKATGARDARPVVADALGYHDKTTTRLLNEAGSQWSRYAAGDHAKSLPRPAAPATRDS